MITTELFCPSLPQEHPSNMECGRAVGDDIARRFNVPGLTAVIVIAEPPSADALH